MHITGVTPFICELVEIDIKEKYLDDLDKNFINAILKVLEEKLERKLSETESKIFTLPRALMAYEMIIDYITDGAKTKEAIEHYVKKVVREFALTNKAAEK